MNIDSQTPQRPALLLSVVLVISTLAVYFQVVDFQFITLDDYNYIINNKHVSTGLTFENIRWAFSSYHSSNWHPLTWISHMIDVQLFGLDYPGGHHIINVLIHTINTLLMMSLWHAMTGDWWRSASVAALFALHPMHVESVAWVAERKDVLSTLFALASMRVYVAYVAKPRLKLQLGVALLFMLSLLSKPMFVTLPCALLLLDYWPLKREFSLRRLIVEKLPLFTLAITSCVITMLAQSHGGAIRSLEQRGLFMRLTHLMVAYCGYLRRLVWPVDLVVYYPMPSTLATIQIIGAAVFLISITVWVIRQRKTQPHLIVGWLWFLGTLVPVIGLISIGGHHIADRYTYVPATGLFVMVAWSVRGRIASSKITHAIVNIMLITLMAASIKQVSYWQNTFTLFGHSLAISDSDYRAHINMGIGRTYSKEYDKAQKHLNKAADLAPRASLPHQLLSLSYQKQGNMDLAIASMRQATELSPNHANYRRIYIGLLGSSGQDQTAIAQFKALISTGKAVSYDYNLYGELLGRMGKLDQAAKQFEIAVRINPANQQAQFNLDKARQIINLRGTP